MLQVIAYATVQLTASGNPCIILQSGLRVFTRKGHHYECGAAKTAAQLVVSGNHFITALSLNFANKVSQEKYVTVNAAPPEPLSNCQYKSIHLSSPICANNVSLDKGPDRELTSAGIMTRYWSA